MAGVVVVVVVVISEGRYDAGSVGCIDMSMVGGGLSSERWRYKSRNQGQRWCSCDKERLSQSLYIPLCS